MLATLLALLLAACNKPDAEQPAVALYTPPAEPAAVEPPKPNLPSFDICLKCLDQRVPVIMYHDVVKDRGPGTVWFDSTAAEFAQQMQTIKDQGYTPVSLDQLHDHLTAGADLPDKAIVLTFDDNYQGFYDFAWPVLKQDNFPVAMFVHTGYVGTTTGRAHMSWDTLKELCKDSLFTVGSHTITHPDLTTLTGDALAKELTDSKSALEQHLGRTIDYFAYPDGRNNVEVQAAVKDAGYKMAVTMENGPAEESPGIECVNRYVQTRLDKALQDATSASFGSVGTFMGPLRSGPVAYKEQLVDGKALALVSGGSPISVTSGAREGVLDFIHRTAGAVAGINGTFFDMAAISSTDNKLVGPCKTNTDSAVLPDIEPDRWPKIRNRPVILWGPTEAAIVPYDPPRMNDDQAYHDLMPDVTDVFLAGAWLVHKGQPVPQEQMTVFASKDIEDPRRRAAFGFLADGTPVAAASKDSVTSNEFANMLEQAGVQEAVLLDSGFSTSLVYGEKIMASGHSTPTMPSRPVPHAIVFKGDLDPASQAAAAAAVPATNNIPESPYTTSTTHHRRRHRRRRTAPVDSTAGPQVSATASPAPTGPPP